MHIGYVSMPIKRQPSSYLIWSAITVDTCPTLLIILLSITHFTL